VLKEHKCLSRFKRKYIVVREVSCSRIDIEDVLENTGIFISSKKFKIVEQLVSLCQA
jgi:hypothetical protein